MSRLEATLDDNPLPDEKARALWARFSKHMDANPGDLAGFARLEGVKSVFPEHLDGKAVLVLSNSREQRPYK